MIVMMMLMIFLFVFSLPTSFKMKGKLSLDLYYDIKTCLIADLTDGTAAV